MDATTVITSRCEQQAVCIRNRGKGDLPCGILFNGHLVAKASDYDGVRIAHKSAGLKTPLEWHELSIYQETQSGKYICNRVTRTIDNDIALVDGGVFDGRDEVVGFFGASGFLERELLQIAEML